jgi:toxin ParE1/3/4
MDVFWTKSSRQDLVDIGDYIALRSPENAVRFVSNLFKLTEGLSLTPFLGRIVPELGREDIREIIHGNYRIIYQLNTETIIILTLFEGHKLLDLHRLDSEHIS